jgi:hypothetical protein
MKDERGRSQESGVGSQKVKCEVKFEALISSLLVLNFSSFLPHPSYFSRDTLIVKIGKFYWRERLGCAMSQRSKSGAG